jgi:hypothetical protein
LITARVDPYRDEDFVFNCWDLREQEIIGTLSYPRGEDGFPSFRESTYVRDGTDTQYIMAFATADSSGEIS